MSFADNGWTGAAQSPFQPWDFNIHQTGGGQTGQAQNYANQAGQQSARQAGINTTNQNALNTAGNSVLNTAFDPQKALYNSQLGDSQNANTVAEAQRGLAMSPYGAGMAADNTNNFNMNWQDRQLGRQEGGLRAAEGAFTTGGSMGEQAVSQTAEAGQIPLAASNQQGPNQQNQAIMQYLAAMSGGGSFGMQGA